MLEIFIDAIKSGAVWTESNVFAAIWYNSIVRKTGGLKDTVILEITATELVMINLLLETSAILSKGNNIR
jgi:hypothetical protein